MSSRIYCIARNLIFKFWRKRREVSFYTEDPICEEIAHTLFCDRQDASDTVGNSSR